jgi:hypothetical protein
MANYTEIVSFSRMAIPNARSKLDRLQALSAGASSDASMKASSSLSERLADVLCRGYTCETHSVDIFIRAGGRGGTGDVF